MFGIEHALDTPVGGTFVPGASGGEQGERKRVSIAEVLAAGSSVQCFDNSTRGLDSSTALDFVRALRTLTDVGDPTTMATLYQSGENLYNFFDKVLLIYDGRQAFFGPIAQARQYFEELGFVRTKGQTSAEFLSCVTDPAHRQVRPFSAAANMHTAADFAATFKSSSYYISLCTEINETVPVQHAVSKGIASFNLSYPQQVVECLWREVKLMRGEIAVHLIKVITTIILSDYRKRVL